MGNNGDEYHYLQNFKIPASVLILNHNNYDTNSYKKVGLFLPARDGTDHDRNALHHAFEDLGIPSKSIEILEDEDLKLGDIKSKIESYANKTYDDVGCLIICVQTHGMKGGILCAYDQLYTIDHLWKPFIQNKINEKLPIIFVILACRSDEGSLREVRVTNDGSNSDAVNKNVDTLAPINTNHKSFEEVISKLSACDFHPNADNMLVLYSTVEDRASLRSVAGSVFIICLSTELRKWKERSLFSILTEANKTGVKKHNFPLLAPTIIDSTKPSALEINDSTKPSASKTNFEINCLSQGQTSTFVSYLNKDIIFKVQPSPSENVANVPNTDLQATSSMSEYDTDGGGSIAALEKEPEYTYKDTEIIYQGRCYILYDKLHENEATELQEIMKTLKFTPKIEQIHSKEECYEKLHRVGRNDNFSKERYLFVAILTTFNKDKHLREELSKFKEPFLATKCSSLAYKAKIFLFLDVKMSDESLLEGDSKVELIATENSDFLYIRGTGEEYKKVLYKHLEQCLDNEKGLLNILTMVRRQYKRETSSTVVKIKPNFESTLTKKIIFRSTTLAIPESEFDETEPIVFGTSDPVEDFKGRKDEKQKLYDLLLKRPSDSCAVVVVHGEANIGKTAFIHKFISENQAQSATNTIKFKNIIILDASNLLDSLERLKEKCKLDPNAQISDIYTTINQNKSLIVFDNVSYISQVQDYLYSNPNLYFVIISSNITKCENDLLLEIPKLRIDEAKEFIRYKLSVEQCQEEDAEELAEKCEYRPLLLSFACYCIENEIGRNDFDNTYTARQFLDAKYIWEDNIVKDIPAKYATHDIHKLLSHFFEILSESDDGDDIP